MVGVFSYSASLVWFICFLSPTIRWQDTGELVTAAHLLTPAHATGYPACLQAAKLFQLIPLGNIALRFNLMNAVMAAGVVACFSGRVGRGGKDILVSLLCVLFAAGLAAYLPFVREATQAENNMILFLMLALFFSLSHDPKRAMMVPCVLMLVVGHYPALLPVWGAALWLLTLNHEKTARRRLRVLGVALACVVLSQHLFLAFRAQSGPPLSLSGIGHYDDLGEVLAASFWFLNPKQWSKGPSTWSAESLTVQKQNLLEAAGSAWFIPFLLVPVGLMGFLSVWRRNRSRALGEIVVFLPFAAILLVNKGQERIAQSIPAWMFVLYWLQRGLISLSATDFLRSRKVLRVGLAAALGAGVVLGVSFSAGRIHRLMDTDPWVAEKLGQETLQAVAPKGLLLLEDDERAFSGYYSSFVQRMRQDVAIVLVPLLVSPWYRERLKAVWPDLSAPVPGPGAPWAARRFSWPAGSESRNILGIIVEQNRKARVIHTDHIVRNLTLGPRRAVRRAEAIPLLVKAAAHSDFFTLLTLLVPYLDAQEVSNWIHIDPEPAFAGFRARPYCGLFTLEQPPSGGGSSAAAGEFRCGSIRRWAVGDGAMDPDPSTRKVLAHMALQRGAYYQLVGDYGRALEEYRALARLKPGVFGDRHDG